MNLQELPTEELTKELDRREEEDRKVFWLIFLEMADKTKEITEKFRSGPIESLEPLQLTQEQYLFVSKDGLESFFHLRGIDVQWEGREGLIALVAQKDGAPVDLVYYKSEQPPKCIGS